MPCRVEVSTIIMWQLHKTLEDTTDDLQQSNFDENSVIVTRIEQIFKQICMIAKIDLNCSILLIEFEEIEYNVKNILEN